MCGIFAIINNNDITHEITNNFNKIQARGPEYTHIMVENDHTFGFHRLSINGINETSNQPFNIDNIILICNGEIYNFKKLINDLQITTHTDSDCEIIIHLYKLYGIEYTLKCLDGVFSFILYDKNNSVIYVARDPYGVRPLFFYHGYDNKIYFSSNLKGIYNFYENEIKLLKYNFNDIQNCNKISQFEAGTFTKYAIDFNNNINKYNIKFNKRYSSFPFKTLKFNNDSIMYTRIYEYLNNAVKKRVVGTCERPIGCLLSGGLDSSLIAALVNKYYTGNTVLKTFSIGLSGSEDLKYAKIVADHLGTEHHEIIVSEDDFFNSIEEVIKTIESYDTTSVRASVGNYLIGKYIKENTDCKVIFNGDGSDELAGGYLYFNDCPNSYEFDKECCRLLSNISYFDVLRSDRCISEHGLEPRTPFLDREWVEFYLSIDKNIRNHNISKNCEKFLIRNAFSINNPQLLPEKILWRTKEAFSDGVSSLQKSWYEIIQDKIIFKIMYDDDLNVDLNNLLDNNNLINRPTTLEQAYYRYLFNKYYKYSDNTIPYFWMPKYSDAKDASARTLKTYNSCNNNLNTTNNTTNNNSQQKVYIMPTLSSNY
jgi:asparagine synthase (glutamine-hydrolysing)